METSFNKQFFYGLGVFALIFFWANVFWDYSGELVNKIRVSKLASVSEVVALGEQKRADTKPEVVSQVMVKENIILAFVGDLMLDRGVEYYVNKNFNGDYEQLFIKVKEQLKSYDLLFANLEGPVSDKGSDGGALYSFRMDPKVIPVLKSIGFKVFSIANNHIFNWGREAFTDTLGRLSEAGIAYTGGGFDGSEAYQEKIINVKDIKIAFLGFSEFKDGGVASTSTNSGIALISEEEIQKSVSQARAGADLVVVSFHFGDEYESAPNKFQRKYAKLAVDTGADLVVGQHPHVVENLERYKNAWIAYSLGNFIFDQSFSEETMQGGLLEVSVDPNTKLIEKITLKKVQLNKMYQIESIE